MTERLGLGPGACLARNPRLVYGRMTGWGQGGPLAPSAGHDINCIALSGALWAIGRAGERPVPPLTLVGDYGGGGMLPSLGIVAARLEARGSGKGHVVDAAMTDGAAQPMAPICGALAMGRRRNARGANRLAGAAPRYDTHECADGRYLAVGPIEAQVLAALLDKLGLDPARFAGPGDPERWPALHAELSAAFRSRPRDAWAALFEGSDACVAPVLDLEEAPRHRHDRARGTSLERDGVVQPAPAPRFSRAPSAPGAPRAEEPPEALLRGFGLTAEEVAALRRAGALFATTTET